MSPFKIELVKNRIQPSVYLKSSFSLVLLVEREPENKKEM